MGKLKEEILSDQDPKCFSCGGRIKPKIVFFDEAEEDCLFCDQLICMGSSLEVYPFAGIVDAPRHRTPRLLINNDLVGSFGARPADAALLGDIVINIERLCEKLEWTKDLGDIQ